MKKIKKLLPLYLVFLIITHCGFSPIYSNTENENLNINILSFSGDVEINNLIKIKLSEIKNSNVKNSFDIKYNSKYTKEILTRDTNGDATNYRLNIEVIFTTIIGGTSREFILQEKSDMKKKSSTFEEEKYEKILNKEMVNLIVEKFIIQLKVSK